MKILTALLLSAALTYAADNRQERGKRVIDQSIAALGGDKFLHMRDRLEEGRAYSFYREQLTGLSIARIYTRYYDDSKDPLKVRERETFGKKEDSIVLFDGKGGYALSYRGVRPMEAERYQRYVDTTRHNVFYILRERLHEPGMIFEYNGSDVLDNHPVESVNITDADGELVTVWFGLSSHLPVKQMYTHQDPQTKEQRKEETIFSKYRDVAGIQWPYNILRLRDGEKIFEIFSEEVKIDSGLNDSLFQLPAGAKMIEDKDLEKRDRELLKKTRKPGDPPPK